MAKRLRFNYTFFPAQNKIVLQGYISPKRLLLITNLESNTLIYSFADPTLAAASVTYSSTHNTTSVVLDYNTSGMSSTDPLQIFTEEDSVRMEPTEMLYDPVNKFRVSQPQALIDTDFEYGTQITKWENLSMVNNRPFAYPNVTGIATVNYMLFPQGSKTVTVGLQTTAPGVGTAIIVQDSYLTIANGNFIVDTTTGVANTIFTYHARNVNTTSLTSIYDSSRTGIFSGTTYANAAIGGAPSYVVSPPTASSVTGLAVTVTTTVPHGLAVGNAISVVGATTCNGSFAVATVLSSTRFVYYTNNVPASTPSGGLVYVRPQGQFLHRAFDGGVIFSSNPTSNYEQAVRQTRRYFRYQSGKGLQVSTGTCIKPSLQIDSLTATGTGIGDTIRVQTKEQHNIQAAVPGTRITIFGADQSGYNGTYEVNTITGFNRFDVTSVAGLGTTVASGNYGMSVTGWYGCVNRMGVYDQQNGLFFEFDGQTLYAGRRSSTYQIAGRVTVTNGSNTVTQTNASFPTFFTKQLQIGGFVVLRGQSYRVVDITSDTSFTITPSYRGASATFVTCSKTIDFKIPQSQWNLDKCDGTGPSGYNLDLTKMQMWYIDYSWYGAGFVRYGFRGPEGDVLYCHKQPNNNVNTEAYMRSGNLPARYESISEPPITTLTSNLSNTETGAIGVGSTGGFPPAGTIVVRNADNYEYINYTGIGTTALTGLTRSQSGALSLALSGIVTGGNVATANTTGLQVGQRIVGASGLAFPDSTFISAIGTGQVTFSQPCNQQNPTVSAAPMGVGIGTTFNYSPTDPVAVEFAYPTFGPSLSHWGTSVIMDGRFDDDKSLVFTYGQTGLVNLAASGANATKALFSIRVAPSIDSNVVGNFGQRELVNRMQLKLDSLAVTVAGISTASILVRAFLNAQPTVAVNWTNAVGNAANTVNSSLAQIADYPSTSNVGIVGGEVIAGFFVGSGVNSIDLSKVRDLGNSILGGGAATSREQIYPDGPDTLTIVATNLTGSAVNVAGRLSWTEAQA